jgi:hypothetical protein
MMSLTSMAQNNGTDLQSSLGSNVIRPETTAILSLTAGQSVYCGAYYQSSAGSASVLLNNPDYNQFSAARLY